MIGLIILGLLVGVSVYQSRVYAHLSKGFTSEEVLNGLVWSVYPLAKYLARTESARNYVRERRRKLKIWHNMGDDYLAVELLISRMLVIGILVFSLVTIIISLQDQEDLLSIIYLMSFTIIAPFIPDYQLRVKYSKIRECVNVEFPEFIQQVALLMKAGLTLQSSLEHAMNNLPEKSRLRLVMVLVEKERNKGMEYIQAFSVLSEILPSRSVNRMIALLNQSRDTGLGNLANHLLSLAEDMMNDQRNITKIKAEKLSTKMLMPMMLSMIGIMALLIFPILQQL